MLSDNKVHRDLVREQLEYCITSAKSFHDEDMLFRLRRALAAFDAPTDMNIFTQEFEEYIILH